MDEKDRKTIEQQLHASSPSPSTGPRRLSRSKLLTANNDSDDSQPALNGAGCGGRRTSYVEFKETGQARLVFSRDFSSFDGVLISDGANDSYILKGRFEESDQPDGHLICNVLVIDHDSGTEYHIKDITVIVENDHAAVTATTGATCNSTNDDDTLARAQPGKIATLSRVMQNQVYHSQQKSMVGTDDQPLNGSLATGFLQDKKPLYEPMGCHPSNSDLKPAAIRMRCESLEFDTEHVLVGNRADTEISQFVSPELVGQGLTVCTGPMRVDVCKFFTPHKAFSARRMSKEFYEQIDAIKQNDFLQ